MACFVELSSNKERTTLEKSVVKTLSQLLNVDIYLLHIFDGRREFAPEIRLQGSPDKAVSFDARAMEELDPALMMTLCTYLSALKFNPPAEVHQQLGRSFWPLFCGELCIDVLVLECPTLTADQQNLLDGIGCVFSNFLSLLEASERDALTGLYNRRIFDTRLSSLIRQSAQPQRQQQERRHSEGDDNQANFLGIIDIDFFKRVNDDFGHLFGDEVLLWLAQHMRQCFRNEDALFRYGGEEFAVLLSGLTHEQAHEAFERFRNVIATTEFPQIGQITVSIGFAVIDPQANPTMVFGAADKALYHVKESGRNRVASFRELVEKDLLEDEAQDTDIELF